MTDDISKVVPFWEWKEKQKAIDDEANGGVPLLRPKDWYHREYGKYVATIQRQGYASFNKGTLTVDVGQFLKDTRTESAATPVDVTPIAWRFDYCGVKPMVWLEKPAENAPMFTNIRALVYADDYATLARRLAKSERDCTELRALLTAQNAAIARTDGLARQLAEATRRLVEVEAYRDATFDGNAVYAALDDRAKSRTSADNVADVLDALNRVARLASEREGLDKPTKPRYNCPTEAHDGEE